MIIKNFNSIKVRLELDDGKNIASSIDDFNSIKVRLELTKYGSFLERLEISIP